MKNPWVLFAIGSVIVLAGSLYYASVVTSGANEGVEAVAHIKGPENPQATLVEYSDFECPACAQFYPIVKEIIETYGDQLAFEYRHFPVIGRNPNAGLAAEAAGQQGKFFEYHDVLFENFEEWTTSSQSRSLFQSYAESIDLDVDEWRRHMRSSILQDKIASDFQTGRDMGVTGTPTFFLDGERMNFETFEDFIGQIEAALGIEPEIDVDLESEVEIGIEDLEVVE